MRFFFLCIVFSGTLFSQNLAVNSVEKNIVSIQSALGLWVNNEAKLQKALTLKTEVGYNTAVHYSSFTGLNFVFVPGFSLEPKWYYNLKRRGINKKNISNNAANYLSVKSLFLYDELNVSTDNDLYLEESQYRFTVNWGLRRNFSEHWNFEFAIGVGTALGVTSLVKEPASNLTLRLGYVL